MFIPPSRFLRDEYEFTQTYEEPECIDPYDVGRSAEEPANPKWRTLQDVPGIKGEVRKPAGNRTDPELFERQEELTG